jgi:Periplasmic binding protein
LYLPLLANTNVSVVQGLQQNNVPMKSIVLATGYTQQLLDQPAAKTIQPNTVFMTANRPIELGGPAVKTFTNNLKKYAGVTGVPDYGTYGGYIGCDMMIRGLQSAGKNPTRTSLVDGLHKLGKYDGAGLICQPVDISLAGFGKSSPTGCAWMVGLKNGKFVVLNHGKPVIGKLIGDPNTVAQATAGAVGATTPPST